MTYKAILLGAGLSALVGQGATAGEKAAPSGTLGEVKFRFDSAALGADAPTALDHVAEFASAHPDTKLVLDAHCDPIGTSDYNVKLAIRRAESVRDRLAQLGVGGDQIVFAIYGEDGERRASYPEDRRVTIWSTHEPLAQLIDHTFAGRGTAVTWQRPLSVAQIEGRQPVASREATPEGTR
ncbi:MAG TPA: OmpA family protein [Kofleriaceae bacterium]|nr:OmpA family protein [Kofleriaceae bacterium]